MTVPTDRVVALTGSAGSLPILKRILGQSRPNGRTTVFLCYHRAGTARFDWSPYAVGYEVRWAVEGDLVEPDVVYMPDRSFDMTVEHGRLHSQPPDTRPHPNIDRLLSSLALEFGARVYAFVLSGLGSDGVVGAMAVRAAGGTILVQHPDSAAFPALPRRVIGGAAPDYILDVDELVEVASRLASGLEIPALRVAR